MSDENLDEKIEYIKELQKNNFVSTRRQSIVLNNFYSIITIIVVCVSIIFYINYVIPAQKAKKLREEKILKHQKYLEFRKKQIELSHKLNGVKDASK